MFYTSDQGCREISAQVLTEFYGNGSWSGEGKCCYSAMDSKSECRRQEEAVQKQLEILEKGISA